RRLLSIIWLGFKSTLCSFDPSKTVAFNFPVSSKSGKIIDVSSVMIYSCFFITSSPPRVLVFSFLQKRSILINKLVYSTRQSSNGSRQTFTFGDFRFPLPNHSSPPLKIESIHFTSWKLFIDDHIFLFLRTYYITNILNCLSILGVIF